MAILQLGPRPAAPSLSSRRTTYSPVTILPHPTGRKTPSQAFSRGSMTSRLLELTRSLRRSIDLSLRRFPSTPRLESGYECIKVFKGDKAIPIKVGPTHRRRSLLHLMRAHVWGRPAHA